MTPIQTAENLWKRYKIQIQSAMVTFMTGLLIHLYVFTNKFFNYFEMGNIFSTMSYEQNDSLGLGRWLMPVSTNLFTIYSSPLMNGVLVMLYMTVAGILICSLFHIDKLMTRCLFGVVWVSFPGFCSLFSYGVNCDAIIFALLLAVAGVYLEEKYRWGMAAGVILIACSVGTYQPMFAAAIGTAFGILFLYALQPEFDGKILWKKGIRLLIMLAAGFLLYYGILHVILTVTGKALSDYRGVNEMTSFTPKGIAKGFVYTYGYFISYFFTKNYQYNILNILCNAAGALFFLTGLIDRCKDLKKTGKKGQLAWVLLLTLLLPLGVNAAPFLMADRVGAGVDIYMMFPILFLWALLIKITDLDHAGRMILQWGTVIVLAAAAVSGYTVNNQAYHRMEAMTQTTESMLERMTARMESLPEWNADMPVYFVNPEKLVNDNYQVEIAEYDRMKNLPGTELKPWYNEDAIVNYMKVYLHFPVNTADEAQKESLDNHPAVRIMPSYPAKDAIQIIDGVIVVKVSDADI